jgi:hypothetical protein
MRSHVLVIHIHRRTAEFRSIGNAWDSMCVHCELYDSIMRVIRPVGNCNNRIKVREVAVGLNMVFVGSHLALYWPVDVAVRQTHPNSAVLT